MHYPLVSGTLAIALFSISAAAEAQAVKIDKVHVDRVQQPASVILQLEDFRKSDAGKALLVAGAALIGADPGQALLVNDTIPRVEKRAGEETHTTIWAPSGYQYCRAKIDVVSMNPGSGSPRAVLKAGMHKAGINLYMVTPQLNDGRRGWVELDVTFVTVRNDLAGSYRSSGKCTAVPDASENAAIPLNCSGNPCGGITY